MSLSRMSGVRLAGAFRKTAMRRRGQAFPRALAQIRMSVAAHERPPPTRQAPPVRRASRGRRHQVVERDQHRRAGRVSVAIERDDELRESMPSRSASSCSTARLAWCGTTNAKSRRSTPSSASSSFTTAVPCAVTNSCTSCRASGRTRPASAPSGRRGARAAAGTWMDPRPRHPCGAGSPGCPCQARPDRPAARPRRRRGRRTSEKVRGQWLARPARWRRRGRGAPARFGSAHPPCASRKRARAHRTDVERVRLSRADQSCTRVAVVGSMRSGDEAASMMTSSRRARCSRARGDSTRRLRAEIGRGRRRPRSGAPRRRSSRR